MKGLVKMSVERVKTEHFDIMETSRGLLLLGNLVSLQVRKNSVKVTFRIHRPYHNHDSYPTITLEVPPDGVVEGGEPAKLTVCGDGGHLMLDMYYRADRRAPPKRLEVSEC